MNKVAIITGASGGIGSAIAEKLSGEGYSLALIYNSNEAKAKELLNSLAADAKIYKCDVSDSKQVSRTVNGILEDFGRIDVLVNNAGVSQIKLFTDITDEDWRRMLDTDLSGAFYFIRAVLRNMINRKSGRNINIASMWGETGGSCEVHYSAAKAGLIGMTKALAKELAPSGITVNAVSPGIIRTDMLSFFSADEIEDLRKDVPLERLGTPEDVAEAVAFLAGGKSAYITGQVISVNGGIVI